jgi:hypothetical protein
MAPGEDIAPILVAEGEPPDAATSLVSGPDYQYLEDWYVVVVPVGQEVAKSRAYARHPEVLYVGPIGYPTFDGDPLPSSPSPTPSPSALPSPTPTVGAFPQTGRASREGGDVGWILAGAAAMLAGAGVFGGALRHARREAG